MNSKISFLSKTLLFISAALLIISIFVPIWRIELAAPQYPEGLCLQIFSYKLGGNVDIINGLNHYIGMKTLHAEDFLEFTLLPYIIGFFATATLLVMLSGNKKLLNVLLIAFIAFGVIAMVDFWRWEYNYGHDLDPEAAIIVPGMAYQPPLIGFKQLLNFGAYSIPDLGGWLFITSGILMVAAFIIEKSKAKKMLKQSPFAVAAAITLVVFSSCSVGDKEPIALNKDNCSHCQMTISDPRFVTELITEKGRVYKFDDFKCMQSFINEKGGTYKSFFVSDYLPPHGLHNVKEMFFIIGDHIKAPMGGTVAAFSDKISAEKYAVEYAAISTTWEELTK